MNILKKLWSKLPSSTQAHVVSFLHTFAASLIVTIGAQITLPNPSFTEDALMSLVISAVRTAIKVALAKEATPTP